jgi:hypothetical protein
MPRSTKPDDDDDDLPVRGLRDDALDERLRDEGHLTPAERQALDKLAREFWGDPDADDDKREYYQLHRHENYPDNPADWVVKPRMSQTEVSLRLARYLISSKLVSDAVTLTLAGYELTRNHKSRFPIHRYLTEDLGFDASEPIENDCRGTYIMKGAEHPLCIAWDRLDGHLITRLRTGQRFVVFVSAGLIATSRSSAEHKQLRGAIGRAMTWDGADAHDLLAVCVPRSLQYRRLTSSFREAEGVKRGRLIILMVDRHADTVFGMPIPGA